MDRSRPRRQLLQCDLLKAAVAVVLSLVSGALLLIVTVLDRRRRR